ncbi:FimB/Mfa2 family fimbrial subunit [Bacteroides sp.]|uniref:FimB/Mfa2 family fimbrial subunit n=1 Tax=Bacteroides sp. TaxID=29523 RepID=UPI00260E37EE|nr:FimB/Mfa2 family fimbrial subunit [Bacteroides sp.]
MKKLVIYSIFAMFLAGCSDDDSTTCPEDNTLITPKIYMDVVTASGQSPLTGILTISPCNAGTSIYFGNYVNNQLTPFYAYYQVKDGTFYDEASNRELSLPTGTYNMVYWGTPKYENPIYAFPAMKEPSYILGVDLSKQAFGLFKIAADTTYYPVFDLVHAIQPAVIGTEDLKASLQRVVAGLKVTVKNKDNGILSSSIDSMIVRITNISEQLNAYTGRPQGNPRTVSFPLVRSVDGTQMSNATVMLFPSIGKPEFQLTIMLKNGTIKTFKQTLDSPLTANTKLTLTLTLGDIFSEDSSGNFTIDNWNESSQTIDIPILS